jgi:hypothetical protein
MCGPRVICDDHLLLSPLAKRGRDSVVGIATRYGLDGPGIESRWGRDFPHPSRPVLYSGYRVFPGGKVAGAWCWSPTPVFSAEVLNWVELYLYLP